MENKIPIQNKIFAFILSLVFSITLLISLFALPIELVFFNQQNYVPLLLDSENADRYPKVISQVLTSELFKGIPSNQQPEILFNKSSLKMVLENNIPEEWSQTVFSELTNQVLDYLNFRVPNASIQLDISQLKSALIPKSEAIVLDYVSRLTRCSKETDEKFGDPGISLDIYQLPPCRPSQELEQAFVMPVAVYLEDTLNRLPDSVSITGVMPYDIEKANDYFYSYSLARWGMRLLPIIAIGLLILIALLLRPERSVMLKWVGRLLVFTCGLGLVGLVILLIGFDQFVVMLVNRYLSNLIAGFDVFLLGLMQKVGYLTLVWVIISFIAVMAFGFFLLLVNRIFKPRTGTSDQNAVEQESIVEEAPLTEINQGEDAILKEFKPETLEEIEAQEKKNLKKKKNNPSI